ncbi:hypothetical protein [Alkalibacterium sp. MB6]|uniref:hypothetical protein n=1 Tax=Alkalibacterium sp. MB6 TaxID=2081965 RepID=UPI00137B8236|nr:hypothetical protein [Alkalibacterium sp. MB6]
MRSHEAKPKKSLWYVLLFSAMMFFTLSLVTSNTIYNILAIGIAIIIYKFGYEELFGEYNRKQKDRKEKARKLYKNMQENYENKKEK